MRQAQTYDFNFKSVEKQYESYQGINVKLRYTQIRFPPSFLNTYAHPGTFSVSWFPDEWRKLPKRRISGFTHSVCRRTAIIQSRWKLGLRIVYILNLSITNPSASTPLTFYCIVSLICLHRYHLKDVIVGKIYFLLVRIKIKHMELSIIRRETTGSPPNQYNESETITKFEIMDGAPVRGQLNPPSFRGLVVKPGQGRQSPSDYSLEGLI